MAAVASGDIAAVRTALRVARPARTALPAAASRVVAAAAPAAAAPARTALRAAAAAPAAAAPARTAPPVAASRTAGLFLFRSVRRTLYRPSVAYRSLGIYSSYSRPDNTRSYNCTFLYHYGISCRFLPPAISGSYREISAFHFMLFLSQKKQKGKV